MYIIHPLYQIHKLYYPEVLFVNTAQSPRKEMCKKPCNWYHSSMKLVCWLEREPIVVFPCSHHLWLKTVSLALWSSMQKHSEQIFHLSSIIKKILFIKLFPTEANLNETPVLQNLMAHSKKKKKTFYHFLSLFLHILM